MANNIPNTALYFFVDDQHPFIHFFPPFLSLSDRHTNKQTKIQTKIQIHFVSVVIHLFGFVPFFFFSQAISMSLS